MEQVPDNAANLPVINSSVKITDADFTVYRYKVYLGIIQVALPSGANHKMDADR